MTNDGWREVDKDEFFRVVGPMDVHPSVTGSWPYTSFWKTRRGDVVAKTVDYLPEGSALTKTRYMLPTEADGPHYQGDVRDILGDGWDLMIGHPPCTRLTNSGVRWLHVPPPGKTKEQMWVELDEAAEFYRTLRDAPIPRKALENPVMHCHARERLGNAKRHVVQPWWFGEPAFKATGFELVGLPPLQPTNRLTPPKAGTPEHKAWSWVHRLPPSEDRWKHRSRTFHGIAAAMAEQWGQ